MVLSQVAWRRGTVDFVADGISLWHDRDRAKLAKVVVESKGVRYFQTLHHHPAEAVGKTPLFVGVIEEQFGGILQVPVSRSYDFALFSFDLLEPERCLLNFLASLEKS
jgi:hypothetical protein